MRSHPVMILAYSIARAVIAVFILSTLCVLVDGVGLLIDGPEKLRDSAPSMIVGSLVLTLLSCWLWKFVTARKRRLIGRLRENR
jgi:hypothetical protein